MPSQGADNPTNRLGGAPAVRAGAALVLGLSVLALWWSWPDPPEGNSRPIPTAAPAPEATKVDPAIWFAERVEPLIDQSRARNEAAARAAIARLEERFDAHRAGVRPFVEDVTSWSARFAIAKRMPADWWDAVFGEDESAKRSRVERFVMGRFRAHVMDERSLELDVQDVVASLAADLEAHRNLLWSEIELALHEADAPVAAPAGDFGAFQEAADLQAAALASEWASDSLVNGVAAFAASAAGGLIAEQAAAQVLARLGAAAASAGATTAAGAVASGSAVAGGAGVGAGGGGALGGPVGMVIGFGAGIAVGAVIDWKMTDSFREKLERELTVYLDDLERSLLEGTADQRGLRAALDEAVRNAADAQKSAALAKWTETTR